MNYAINYTKVIITFLRFLKITFEQCLKMRMGGEENNKFYYVIDTMNKQIENDLNRLPMKMFTDYRILHIYLKADIKKPFALIAIKGLKKTHKFEECFWEQMLSMFNKRQDNLTHKSVRYCNKNTNAQAFSDGYENELSGYMAAEMSKMRLKEDDRSTNEMGKNNALLGSKTDKCITKNKEWDFGSGSDPDRSLNWQDDDKMTPGGAEEKSTRSVFIFLGNYKLCKELQKIDNISIRYTGPGQSVYNVLCELRLKSCLFIIMHHDDVRNAGFAAYILSFNHKETKKIPIYIGGDNLNALLCDNCMSGKSSCINECFVIHSSVYAL